ncbi:hypothetical protein AB1Y20_000282 [Prymnesium parvum]|uniref:Uncharacterized protein n=1 Tax=Prymnesium parvum TaxID=97485 RepID=A0AB34JAP8_PRYPA
MLAGGGDSAAWKEKKTNVIRLFDDKFRVSDGEREARYGLWKDLPEDVACSEELYERLAHYLVNEHTIPEGQRNAGAFLSCNVAINYLCILLNMAAAKFKTIGNDRTKLFLTCLDVNASTQAAMWLRGLKKKMTRIIFERAKESGQEMDMSAPPLYLEHVQLISQAYAKEASAEVHV